MGRGDGGLRGGRQLLVEQFAKRAPDGTIITQPGANSTMATLVHDPAAFEEAFRLLHATWRDRLNEASAAKAERWQELTDTPVEPLPLHRVPIPVWEQMKGMVSIEIADALMPIVERPPAAVALGDHDVATNAAVSRDEALKWQAASRRSAIRRFPRSIC